MRRLLAITLVLTMCLGLGACGRDPEASDADTSPTETVADAIETESTETLETPETETAGELSQFEFEGIVFEYDDDHELIRNDQLVSIIYERGVAGMFITLVATEALKTPESDVGATLELALHQVMNTFSDRQDEKVQDVVIAKNVGMMATFAGDLDGTTFGVIAVALTDGEWFYNAYYTYNISDNTNSNSYELYEAYSEEFINTIDSIVPISK